MSSSTSNRSKRALENETLTRLLGDGKVSYQALQRLLKKVNEGETPGTSWRQICAAAGERFKQVEHTEVLQDAEGHEIKWTFCDPCRLLQYMIEVCPKLQQIYCNAAKAHPAGEWSAIVMFDEFAPGMQLKANNHRKSMTLCFSFLELGRRALVTPCVWMIPVVVRTNLYSASKGGWSRFLKIFLERMFLGPNGLQATGVPLILGGDSFLLKASLAHLLSDGDGLRSALSWRGASSLRPCWCHWNVTKKDSGLKEHNPALVETSCADFLKFQLQTDHMVSENVALVKAAYERLAQGNIAKSMVDSICQSTGITYNEFGLLWDDRIRSMVTQKVVTIDWVHTMLCDGVFGCEVHLFLSRAQQKLGIGFESVRGFLVGWTLPCHSKATMHEVRRVFTDFRHSYAENHEKMKASASELLSTYGLLRHFVCRHVQDACMVEETSSFELCCHLIDGILDAKHGQTSMNESSLWLKRAHKAFLEMHISCYGSEYIKPKHHWVFDIAEQWSLHSFVPDAFLIEKQHLAAKSIGNRVRNTTTFEKSVLSGMLNSQVQSIGQLGQDFELMHNAIPFPGLETSVVADTVSIMGVQMSVDDIVLYNDTAGRVIACIQEGEEFSLVVDSLATHRPLTPHAYICALQSRRVVWNAKLVRLALAWRQSEQYAGCLEIIKR
jgi:hypothetical protein